jgi:aspartyl aminopeptidase
MNTNQELFDYIASSPSPYHAVASTTEILSKNGFTELCENGEWTLEAGHAYYVTRNSSSLIAFRTPSDDFSGFMITAAHCDSPCFKVKDNSQLCDGSYIRLSGERYGGMLCSTWLDRPLSVAGRVAVKNSSGFEMKLVDLSVPCALIPNIAIHLNRNANDSASYNPATDMIALWSDSEGKRTFKSSLAKSAGCDEKDIVAQDLFLYNTQHGTKWSNYISAPRLDDLQCAFAALKALLNANAEKNLPVYCLFDNEEVGSQTKQGAASTFLQDILERISASLSLTPIQIKNKIANSFLVSCDNAHAVHPNHPELSDKNHSVYMNRGIVIKHNANQKYTTDAVSAALFRLICQKCGVPCQDYANRADMPGGSTLGNIANTKVSLNSVDIGLAQLAMHSSYETAGADDTDYMIKALTEFYAQSINISGNSYEIK